MRFFVNNLKSAFKKLLFSETKKNYEFDLQETSTEFEQSAEEPSNSITSKCQKIYSSIDVNLEYLRIKYNSLINSDVSLREFTLIAKDKSYRALLVYIDGMIQTSDVNDFILKPLMLRNRANVFEDKERIAIASNISVKKVKKFNLEDYIYNCLMPQNNVTKINMFDDMISSVNSGNTVLIVDTLGIAFDIDLKGFKQRSISTPQNEIVIRGSQESFVEAIRTNTSMIRRIVNNENLIIENCVVGN